MPDLVSINLVQPLSIHRPDVYDGISIRPGTHNVSLTLRNVQTTCICFINIPLEFFNFSEIDSSLSTFKFIVCYRFFKS